ncbi:uncharacterized protein LOC144435579 [Glandiceps talaboti]
MPNCTISTSKLFADDTKIFTRSDVQDGPTTLQQDLNSLQLLKFHPQKCKVLQLGRNSPHTTYTMGSDQPVILEHISEEKDLGVTIDYKLSFDQHIAKITQSANRLLGIICRTFNFLDKDTFLFLYRGLIRPHLEYAHSVWTPYKAHQINTIESVQRRATKLIPGLHELTYPERLRSLELPTLTYRRVRGDMIEVYKLTHGLYNLSSTLLRLDTSQVTRGHPYKLKKLNTPSLEIRRHFFSNRVFQPWNSLPDNVVNAPTINSFKSRLDRHWSAKLFLYEYSIDPYFQYRRTGKYALD